MLINTHHGVALRCGARHEGLAPITKMWRMGVALRRGAYYENVAHKCDAHHEDVAYIVKVWHTSRSVVHITKCGRSTCAFMCQSRLHAVLRSHIGILLRLPAAEPRSIAGLLFPSQYLSGTIWLTPYLMVWDWRVSRTGAMPFCWPSCSLLFCLQPFSLSLLFLYRLVVWGWGLRTDRVSISLSRPCIADLF